MSRLFYRKSAGWNWNGALPIGGGKLGAMIYGNETFDHYQLNEDSVWFGGPRDRNNPDAKDNLERVRELILTGRIPEAENLLKFAFSGTPQSMGPYQTLGDVYFDYMGKLSHPINYERELCLEEALHKVTVQEKSTGVIYSREAFVSAPRNCIISRFRADKKGELSLAASLQRICLYEKSEHTQDTLYISGSLGGDGSSFCAAIKIVPESGNVQALGEHVIVENTNAVTVFITAATTFRESNPREAVDKILMSVSGESYEDLKTEHIEDYQALFKRVVIDLPYNKEFDNLTTEERLERIDHGQPDNGLISTYFDYGRYLLISCSRPGSLPANLQGIWCQDTTPPWQSKYTININTEMNYWPAGSCNLSECEGPLFDLLEKMERNGRKTATDMYGCNGFVAHHNTNQWADTAPQDICISATYWVMGGAWLCTHIWEHFQFTMDKKFLHRMYPVLKSAVVFYLDFLVEEGGEMVTCPSVSPENTYIMKDGTSGCVCAGASMDNQMLRDLFAYTIESAKILEIEETEFIEKVKLYVSKLPPIKIGKHGQIMEWREDYEEAEPGHRHISHLYALHPSSQIMKDRTPELADAAMITLKRRLKNGGGHTGWSRAWIMNMYARLWDGEEAYDNLIQLLKKSTLLNLLDNHPPFQIDGNFGSIAAIAEMLLQSNGGRVVLLPACPKEWTFGRISGICARGGAEYTIIWEESGIKEFTITAKSDYDTSVYFKETCIPVTMKVGETKTFTIST